MGSVRWAFRCGSWTPSRSDWLFAARCIQREEKDRIGQFVFAKDAKSAMVSGAVLILPMLTCCTVLYVLSVLWSPGRLAGCCWEDLCVRSCGSRGRRSDWNDPPEGNLTWQQHRMSKLWVFVSLHASAYFIVYCSSLTATGFLSLLP